MIQQSTSIVLAHKLPNGVFTITLEVKLDKIAETLYFPNRRDRNILYRLLFETGSYGRPEKIPPVFIFKTSSELTAMFSEWLQKLSQISAHIDAVFTSNGHDNSQNTRRSAVLQFVNDYEIGEKDAGDRWVVKIEFADWIREEYSSRVTARENPRFSGQRWLRRDWQEDCSPHCGARPVAVGTYLTIWRVATNK